MSVLDTWSHWVFVMTAKMNARNEIDHTISSGAGKVVWCLKSKTLATTTQVLQQLPLHSNCVADMAMVTGGDAFFVTAL